MLNVRNSYVGSQPFDWELRSHWLNIHGGLLYDFLLQLLFAYLLYFLLRSRSVFILLQGLLVGALYVGNAVKTSIMGTPIEPLDVYAAAEAAAILGIDGRLLYLPLLPVAGVLLWDLKRHWLAWLSLPLVAVGVTVAFATLSPQIHAALDHGIERRDWDRRFNHDARGTTVYLINELARMITQIDGKPDLDAVRSTLAAASSTPGRSMPGLPTGPPRNVYLILVESLWDPMLLRNAEFSKDPVDPTLRRLWSEAGSPSLLSPVFGGQTAEAEFELLCGQPVSRQGITFERGLSHPSQPCLPRLLAAQGYETVAIHPNRPGFWNRGDSYRKLGFDDFVSSQSLTMDDMGGAYLSNKSLFQQAEAVLASKRRPFFAYILTIAEHWPYVLPPDRGREVTTTSAVPAVGDYANALRHSTREISDFIDRIRQRDPEALVVIAGDHLPLLGAGMSGYRESGLAFDEAPSRPQEIVTKYAAPLILIDGPRGPGRTPTAAMYEFPRLVLQTIGRPIPDEIAFFTPPPNTLVRPLPSGRILVLEGNRYHTCSAEAADGTCGTVAQWLRQRGLISADLRSGDQHALALWRGGD